MHELCSLLTHIPTYLMLYPYFFIDFLGFTNDPLYFGYNPVGQKSMFCVFLAFRDLNEVKLS
jgi:hypothetical protein